MYHIPNDVRAKKSVNLIIQGLEKCLEEKPYNQIKINDVYKHCYVSRATFYRLFDSIDDVLLYQCECIRNEGLESISKFDLKDTKELGIYTLRLWLKHESLVKAIIENRLYGILYEAHMRHPEDFKTLYSVDFVNESQLIYFTSFIVSILFCSLNVYLKEKKERTIEELIEYTNGMVAKIVSAWGIK